MTVIEELMARAKKWTGVSISTSQGQLELVEKGTYIEFRIIGPSESGKTSVWAVFNSGETVPLGIVSWFGRWRKYTFTTDIGNVYEQVCLREIADFVEKQTKEHRKKKK